MQYPKQPLIRDLAFIGDKKSCAIVDKSGTVVWYCLWRFDQPAVFSLLIDEQGGFWSVDAPGKTFSSRAYDDDTAILVSHFKVEGGSFSITDFMPANAPFSGICRLFSPSPVPITMRLLPKPNYARSAARLRMGSDGKTVLENNFEFYIKGSHPLTIHDQCVTMTVPAGEEGWCALVDEKQALPYLSATHLHLALHQTAAKWKDIMGNMEYDGVYRQQLFQSYKAIHLVTHEHSGGILAAATTALPEVIGGKRNYDYRYVWLRDTAMDVSSLVRANSKGKEAERFLDFLCMARDTNKKNLFVPFYDLDNKTAPLETKIPGTGYQRSVPLRIGNNAYDQLQLDAQGNVLLAAKEIYSQQKGKPHWKTVVHTAEFVVENWHLKDNGIWEEHTQEHYTSSKVLVAKSLEFLADYADNDKQKNRWIATAKKIRQFVASHCITSDGAYAVFAGSQAVDITSALYAVWWYDKPDSAAMKQTVRRIEEDLKEGALYHRHLVQFDAHKEGVFLAGSLWMAQHYLMLKDIAKAKIIIDAVLSFATDLGFLPEEGDVTTGAPLGNIPQTFVHASLIGAILDYNKAIAAR